MEPFQNRTDRPRVYTGTDGSVPYRTASGTRTGPPRKLVPHVTEPKSHRVNFQNLFSSNTLRNEARGILTEDS